MTKLPGSMAPDAFAKIAENRMTDFLAGIGGPSHPSRLLAAKRLAACETILDVGCGPGVFLHTLQDTRPEGFTYVGVDPVPAMTDAAERLHRKHYLGPWRNARAEELPFPDRTFQGVLVRHVLEHLQAPVPALREAARVCDRDLVLVFSQWTNPRRSIVSDSHLQALRWSHHDSTLFVAVPEFHTVARYIWRPGGTVEACRDEMVTETLAPREEFWHLSRNPTASLAALEVAAQSSSK